MESCKDLKRRVCRPSYCLGSTSETLYSGKRLDSHFTVRKYANPSAGSPVRREENGLVSLEAQKNLSRGWAECGAHALNIPMEGSSSPAMLNAGRGPTSPSSDISRRAMQSERARWLAAEPGSKSNDDPRMTTSTVVSSDRVFL